MSEIETTQTTAETTAAVSAAVTEKAKKKPTSIIAAIVIVAVIILGVLYVLEKQGRSSTTIFSSLIEQQRQNEVVATVNDQKITAGQLEVSIRQFGQAAAAQGVDVSSPEIQAEMRTQALEVLINTALLKQDAIARGVTVGDEQVSTRVEEIKTELGGEEVLAERMEALSIDPAQLENDIRDEIIIQALLDMVFADAAIEVTEEEIAEVYEGAGGEAVGLPPLEEVREQVAAQVRASKEQAAIDGYLTKLREEAEIEIEA